MQSGGVQQVAPWVVHPAGPGAGQVVGPGVVVHPAAPGVAQQVVPGGIPSLPPGTLIQVAPGVVLQVPPGPQPTHPGVRP
jgi:hypothetical protein